MAKKNSERHYKAKDVDMLSACDTIMAQAEKHKVFLQSKRSNWTDSYFEEIREEIQNAFTNILGIDSVKELREATQKVLSVKNAAVKDLAEFKVQIEEDFKKDKPKLNELLTNLGFSRYHKSAQKGSQESMIQLLFQFKDNMTEALKTEISEKGIAEEVVNNISAYADLLKDYNITQESLKGSRQEITQSSVEELNEIYDSVISIAKIASKFFKDNKVIQKEFSFNHTVSLLN